MEYSNDPFVIESDGYKYEDSIVMPIDEYNAKTPEEIQQMKIDRFTVWRQRITQPVQPDEDIIPEVPVHEEPMTEEEFLKPENMIVGEGVAA